MIEQHEHTLKTGVNSCVTEELGIPAKYAAPVVFSSVNNVTIKHEWEIPSLIGCLRADLH